MTAGALILFVAFLVLRVTVLADSASAYQNLSDFALGLTAAVLLLNIMYCAGLLDKIRAAKISFVNKLKAKNVK